MTDYLLTNDAGIIGGTLSTEAGTFDTNYASHSIRLNRNENHPIAVPGELGEYWVQFHYYFDKGSTGANEDGYLWNCYTADGWLYAYTGMVDGGFTNMVSRQATYSSVGKGSGWTFPFDTLVVVDIHVKQGGSAGNNQHVLYEVYINNSLVSSFDADFLHGTSSAYTMGDVFCLGGNDYMAADANVYISNVRVSDQSTLGTRFRLLELDTVGYYNQWPGGFAALADGDPTTASYSDTAGQRVSGFLDTTGLSAASIASVAFVTKGRNGGPTADPNTLAPFFRIGGTDYDQTPATPRGSWEVSITEVANNPANGSPWTPADIAALEIGLLSSTV